MHHPTASSSAPRPTVSFLFSWHSEPTVGRCRPLHLRAFRSGARICGTNANRIAEYGLPKCFIPDASPPSNHAMFRETAQCFRTRPRLRPPSPVAVRAATLISVTFPSLMRAKRMRARASTDGVLRFPTGVYSTTPSVQNRVYMHVFAPPPARNCLWSSGLDVASTQQLCSTI